jgi:hypothetical protein
MKILRYISSIIICVWLIRPIVFWLIGIDFASEQLRINYGNILIFIVPLAIIGTISFEYRNGKTPTKNLVKSELGNRIAFASIIFVMLCFWSFMSVFVVGYQKEIYYKNKINNGEIILINYGVGAHDSNPNPTEEIRLIIPINSFIKWSYNCDTTTFNLDGWKAERRVKPGTFYSR